MASIASINSSMVSTICRLFCVLIMKGVGIVAARYKSLSNNFFSQNKYKSRNIKYKINHINYF